MCGCRVFDAGSSDGGVGGVAGKDGGSGDDGSDIVSGLGVRAGVCQKKTELL